jgi:hypothetical protein
METENKRIQFDWEKYQSGEYQAVCRDGSIPEMITYNPNATENSQIVFWYKGEAHATSIEGFKFGYSHNNASDLFLVPKPKRFQAWVNLYSNGHIESYILKSDANLLQSRYENDCVKFIETRLIEWEG